MSTMANNASSRKSSSSRHRDAGSVKIQLMTGETLLCSSTTGHGASHEKEVALVLSKQVAKSLVEWEPISELIIMARFESKFQKSTILQACASTNEADEEEK